MRGHVRKKHQETERSKRARALRMVSGARWRGGEGGCGDGAAKATREVTKALRGWKETTEVAVTEAG